MKNQYIRTLKIVFQSPKVVVDAFIETNSSEYTHPFKFLIFGAVPFIIISSLLVDFSTVSTPPAPGSPEQLSYWIDISTVRLSTQFLSFSLFFLIPLLSLPALFFLRDELKGFYSHLILNSYAIGAAMWSILPLIPIWVFINVPQSNPFMYSTLPSLFIGLTLIFIYIRFFSVQNLMGWIRSLSTLITGYLLFMLVKGLFAGVVGYMIFAVIRLSELSGM